MASVLWAPFPGFQTLALRASESELFLGGAKGPGKTDVVLVKALQQIGRPQFKGLVLRASYWELQDIERRTRKLYGAVGGVYRADSKVWTFPSGAVVVLGYCANTDDVRRYQGQEWSYIAYDELGECPFEEVVDELLKELRSPDPRIRTQFVATGNPGGAGHAWIRRRYVLPTDYGRKVYRYEMEVPGLGKVVLSRRFIPGRVWDNPIYANDPQYMAKLHALPDRRKQQLLHGDWDVGDRMALEELDARVHLVSSFEVPDHWPMWGGLDWGYRHRWVFGWYTISDEGRVYKLDTLTGHKQLVPDIAQEIKARVPVERLEALWAGPDIFAKPQARGHVVPSIAEEFGEHGLVFTPWDARPGSRVAALNNLRKWLAWVGRGPDGGDGVPGLLFFDTPGNRWCFEQLAAMVIDPKKPDDVLKVDCNEDGEGGDDAYDETKGSMSVRPYASPLEDIRPPHHRRVWAKVEAKLAEHRQAQEEVESLGLDLSVAEYRDQRSAMIQDLWV